MTALSLRCHSVFNAIFFALRRRLCFSRPGYTESGCDLTPCTPRQISEIRRLAKKYGVCFESHFLLQTTLDCYQILSFLDQIDTHRPAHCLSADKPDVLDVGSKNFYYAHALFAKFGPATLTGVELDGYKIYENFHSRKDYADFYINRLPHTRYYVMDICDYHQLTDVITLFYPFVVPEPLVRWTLPLSEFKPHRIFGHVARQLRSNGLLYMVNQGFEESKIACDFAAQAGFVPVANNITLNALTDVNDVPIGSLWRLA